MLSRSVYDFYLKRLKITQNLDPRLLLKKDLEIRNKFELVVFVEDNGIAVERLVEKGKEKRKLIAIEEVFFPPLYGQSFTTVLRFRQKNVYLFQKASFLG
jgi:hypothetical protein